MEKYERPQAEMMLPQPLHWAEVSAQLQPDQSSFAAGNAIEEGFKKGLTTRASLYCILLCFCALSAGSKPAGK